LGHSWLTLRLDLAVSFALLALLEAAFSTAGLALASRELDRRAAPAASA
jgi:hypothetical protein